MSKPVAWPSCILLCFALFLGQTRHANADDVAIVICDVAAFSCPAADIVGNSLFQLIPNNLLGPNQYTVQSVVYNANGIDLNATFVTADSRGTYIYAWGTATVTATGAVAGDFLDVSIRQSYVTVPGTWAFGEMLTGSCDANAIGSAASVGFQGQVNAVNLPVIGPPGDCSLSPFSYTAGGILRGLGSITQMIGGVQYAFPEGGAYNETITLPFGDDYPDPTINFNDPNNPDNFITDTDIPAGFTEIANSPEPSTWYLVGSGIGALALLRKRSK
jgi:hypothetical protein